MAANDMVKRRSNYAESLDDFPTPRWATRALVECVLGEDALRGKSVLEPACGRGHMAESLSEYGAVVTAQDVKCYGYPKHQNLVDFSRVNAPARRHDWVITNPPYKLAQAFYNEAMQSSTKGVALLMRVQWLIGKTRYYDIFSNAHIYYRGIAKGRFE